ncbi:glycosyltransferase family A protein [Algoriphagus sp. A40]|uniref:glycosyltransferase family A protein n=1 Tax=Algoriphagus sp. A40 TaxID=1945863 RepID=UPI0009CDB725|nr:glycosyltransferase family A protein [Algoriphagus sp. A40]OOG74601.1 hypothetical protein B0E43_11410 [Algoriphagus sp. A40]
MRVGINPSKLDPIVPKVFYHRIIIPVFIPNFNGYFQKILEVYKTCLESARVSQHSRSAITVVDNGSCTEVRTWLRELLDQGKIETLVTQSSNIGKVDAILGIARSCREDLITIADSDILFKNGWQEAVEEVFLNFPDAGSVAPFPISRHMYYFSSSVQKAVVQRRLKFAFEKSVEFQGIKDNYSCYNWNFDESYDTILPVLKKGSSKAVMGSGHQVMTIRREAIFKMPFHPCFIKISSKSENLWIDMPIDDSGLWRLSTLDTWVDHMGNELTDKNLDVFSKLTKNPKQPEMIQLPQLNARPITLFEKRFYSRVFRSIYESRPPAPKLKIHAEQDGVL